jgi:hypothetical protein
LNDSENKIFDPNPKSRIWEGERVTQSEYERRLKEAQTLEIYKGLKSVAEYDTTGFDEELYKDEQFVPAILEVLVSTDFRANIHQRISAITAMRGAVLEWFHDREWLPELVEGLDEQIEKLHVEVEAFEAELRKANSDI